MPPKGLAADRGLLVKSGRGVKGRLPAEKAGILRAPPLYPCPHFFISAPCAQKFRQRSQRPALRKSRGKPEKTADVRPKPELPHRTGSGALWLYGLHAVQAALANPRRKLGRAVLTPRAAETIGSKLLGRVRVETRTPTPSTGCCRPARCIRARRWKPGRSSPRSGCVLEPTVAAGAGWFWCWTSFPIPTMSARSCARPPLSASTAVVVQDRHAPPQSGALAKAASGALDIVPYIEVVNIARALDELAERGFWRIALAGDGEQSLAEAVARRRCGAGAGLGRRRHPPSGARTLRSVRLHSDRGQDGEPQRLQRRGDRALRIAPPGTLSLTGPLSPRQSSGGDMRSVLLWAIGIPHADHHHSLAGHRPRLTRVLQKSATTSPLPP